MKKTTILLLLPLLLAASCNRNKKETDASGTFEAIEVLVSAEVSGLIKELNIEEGQELKAGQYIGAIDSTQYYLRYLQLKAQSKAVLSRKPDAGAQIAALEEQLKQAEREQQRVSNLYQADAATRKQLDDANSLVAVLRKQIGAQRSSLNITSSSLGEEATPLDLQAAQAADQLQKCRLLNETPGTVLSKYAEVNEMAVAGKALYKIADLSVLVLRAYISGNQLAAIKPGAKVKVLTDSKDGGTKTYEGVVEWISDKAEFTPKTIQTKDERANLVYAIKIRVKNDGYLKIGMYADVQF
jgi:HlyD family secretion protein